MEDEGNQKEKQSFLRKSILEKGLDSEKFVDFLIEKKGEEGDDISNWTMEELKAIVKEFYELNNISDEEIINEIDNNSKNDESIKFIIDEDSLMNLFKQNNIEYNSNINVISINNKEIINNIGNNSNNDKKLFDFEKNFKKFNKPININNKKDNEDKEIINYNDKMDKEEIDSDYGIIMADTVKCKLMEKTEFREHKDIKIVIKDPIKLETKLFSGKSVSYSVITYPFNYMVKRRYSDFNWLRDILSVLYNNILIPKMSENGKLVLDKHDDVFINKRMKYLERFINYIIKDEIIKTSQILYDFLTIKKYDDFIRKKKEYEKIKVFNFIDIKDRKTMNGELDIKINKEKEIYLENIKDNAILNGNLFKKLDYNLKLLVEDFSLIVKRSESIANIYKDIFEVSNKYLDLNIIRESYSQMKIMFSNLSKSYEKIKNFIDLEIRQYFKFIGNNYTCLHEMFQNVDISKYNYIKIKKHLINKKIELFKKGDISKWELSEEKIELNKLMKDKILAYNKMLPQETKNCIKNKMIYGFYLNDIINEYEKMRKLNSYLHKRKISFFCSEQISIYSEYNRILGDVLLAIDSCVNK